MPTKFFVLSLVAVLLCSCVETVVVGAVAGGIIVANSSDSPKKVTKSTKTNSHEKEIKKTIDNFLEVEGKNYKNINVNVLNDRILLTGYVKDIRYKQMAVKDTTNLYPTNEIIDEIIVINPNQKVSKFNDYFISKKVSFRLGGVKNIDKSNYKYDVTNATVVVIGKSQNQEQSEQVTSTISRTRGVKKVISYI